MRVFRSVSYIFFVIICGFAPAHAQEGEVAKLEAVTDGMLNILYDDTYKQYTYEQKESAIRSILEENYDLMIIIRRALARNWDLLSTEEQSQVYELVTKLVVKTFIDAIQGLDQPIVEYGDLVMITGKRFEIPSVITFPSKRTFNVVYRFGRLKSGWQIYDIVAENVSVVSNYRQQFDDHFRKGTGAELIKKLEKFLEENSVNENIKL